MEVISIYLLSWFGMLILAILNGIIREKGYGRFMSELAAHQVSTITAIILFGIYVFAVAGFQEIQSARQALAIGTVWTAMTVSFEFIFGHYVAGHSWSKLLSDYNVFRGRIWILVLVWIFISPLIFYMN